MSAGSAPPPPERKRGRPAEGRPRTIRVDDALWAAATDVAKGRGETVSEVARDLLRRYVARHAPAGES